MELGGNDFVGRRGEGDAGGAAREERKEGSMVGERGGSAGDC